MNEREREGFIRKIGISADDTDESDDDEENDTERHKYNCKKCQVSFVSTNVVASCTQLTRSRRYSWNNVLLSCGFSSSRPLKNT